MSSSLPSLVEGLSLTDTPSQQPSDQALIAGSFSGRRVFTLDDVFSPNVFDANENIFRNPIADALPIFAARIIDTVAEYANDMEERNKDILNWLTSYSPYTVPESIRSWGKDITSLNLQVEKPQVTVFRHRSINASIFQLSVFPTFPNLQRVKINCEYDTLFLLRQLTSLQHLEFDVQWQHDHEPSSYYNIVSEGMPQLRSLSINAENRDMERALQKLLTPLQKLEKLVIRNIHTNYDGEYLCEKLSDSLEKLPHVKQLWLRFNDRYCHFFPDFFKAMAKVISLPIPMICIEACSSLVPRCLQFEAGIVPKTLIIKDCALITEKDCADFNDKMTNVKAIYIETA